MKKTFLTLLCAFVSIPLLADPAPDRVIVYYFHGTARCPSCMKIEKYTKACLTRDFPAQLQSGKLDLRVVNVEEKGNEHYVQDYGLYTKSVVLSLMKNGKQTRWENLPKVWELLGDESAFSSYVKDKTAAFLREL